MAHAWLALSSSAAGFGSNATGLASTATGFGSSAARFGVLNSFASDESALGAEFGFCVTNEDLDFIMDSLC